MKTFESNMSAAGIATVPRALRLALGAELGGRLVWSLSPDGTLRVALKHAYFRPPARRGGQALAEEAHQATQAPCGSG
jgi:hypothetical protein